MAQDNLWRGFRAYAVALALTVRQKIDSSADGPLDIERLTAAYGITVIPMSQLPCEGEAIDHFTVLHPDKLSGMVISTPHGRGVLLNNSHGLERQRSTIGHEASHVILDHEPGFGLAGNNVCTARGVEQEAEASWLSGELLFPKMAARSAVFRGEALSDIAVKFGISIEMVRWRINICGAKQMQRN